MLASAWNTVKKHQFSWSPLNITTSSPLDDALHTDVGNDPHSLRGESPTDLFNATQTTVTAPKFDALSLS